MKLPKEFTYIDEQIPELKWDIKYATWDNFTGTPVTGYHANRVIGTTKLSAQLKEAQQEAHDLGYGFLIWDAYRPKQAVSAFVQWVHGRDFEATKKRFYPYVERSSMIEEGYIAAKSGHSRGSTVDLTLYNLSTKSLISMGGDFDFMDVSSHHGYTGILRDAQRNREILKGIMTNHGFYAYQCEWWHYTLQKEPFPDTYFDFPVVS